MGPMLGPDVEINVDALIPRNAAEKVGSASIDIVSSTGELIRIIGVVGGGACCEGDGGGVLRYCRNVRPMWVKFDSKDTKESEFGFEVLSTKSKKRT